MKEVDLVQATVSWLNLAYTTSQWWITVTTALIVVTYFAAKHIPAWLFAVVVLLYLVTAVSVLFEFSEYSELSYSYGIRMTEMRIANHVPGADAEPSAILRHINGVANYVIIVAGTFLAVAFSFIHWRKTRNA
jgi:hypothetical protein